MSIYSDNQTKHFYVASANATNNTINGVVKDLEDSDLFRIILDQDNGKKVTSDVINRKLIKKIKINEVKPTFLRKWTTLAISSNDLKPATTYHIYFYLEIMMGFGMQDRWDRVASYTTDIYDNNGTPATHDTVITVMENLAKDLDMKLNGTRKEVAGDTVAQYLNRPIVAKTGPISGDFKVTYVAATQNDPAKIEVEEDSTSDTFTPLEERDLRMHTNPYAYNVTMSTGMTTERGIEPWGGQRQIIADKTDNVYISSATKVMAMELYFLRNRGDLYDLTKDFYTSILNEPQELTANATYYTLDIDYAFSDTQGYTYHSDKQLSIACSNKQALQTFKLNILNDSNESAYSANNSVTYTHTNDDDD